LISYEVYLLVHVVGIIFLFVILGGVSLAASRPTSPGRPGLSRRSTAILHGTALFIVLLGGFGLLARLGIAHGMDWPAWVWAKLAIWALAGAAVVVPRRKPEWARSLFLALPVLGGIAAWLAIFKPI
jgi:hypothetical protein